MFQLHADKIKLSVRQREAVTSGSVNVYPVRFGFSEDWKELSRTAVFRAGTASRAVPLGADNETVIPWEVLKKPSVQLLCGVYGTRGSETVLPTVWANLGFIQEGASPGEEAQPPTPELWEQALAAKQDKLVGQPGQAVGFDQDGNAVAVYFEAGIATDEEVNEMLDEVFGPAGQ